MSIAYARRGIDGCAHIAMANDTFAISPVQMMIAWKISPWSMPRLPSSMIAAAIPRPWHLLTQDLLQIRLTSSMAYHSSAYQASSIKSMNTISALPNLTATLESYLCSSLTVSPTSNPPSDPSLPALHLLAAPTLGRLRNAGPARIRDMRLLLGHSRQVLSHLPLSASPQTCTRFNDALHAAIRLHAEKFSGLALLPSRKGEAREAAKELQRCVTKYGFVGGVVGLKRGVDGERLVSGAEFEVVWDTAVKCRVPIALRELWPMVEEVSLYAYNIREREREREER